jgi:hypothetical protein
MDDDVELMQKHGGKTKPLETPLPVLAERAFALCQETGARLWGSVTSSNGFFQKHEVVFGLRDCTGALIGEYAQETDCQSQLNSCEDSEKIFLHYRKYGGMLRMNDVCGKNKFYSPGGVNAFYGGKEKRFEDYLANLRVLEQQYPDLVAVQEKNLDSPGKQWTKIKNKTVSRHPSLLDLPADE